MVKNKNKDQEKKNKEQNKKKKLLPALKRKPWLYGFIAIILIVIVIFIVNRTRANDGIAEDLQTQLVMRGDLVAIVGATGVVEPNQTVSLGWQTTGRVETVNVSINDQVEAGEILATLADNTLPQSVILAKADLVEAKRVLEDLQDSTTASSVAYTNLLEAEADLREAEDDRDYWNYNEASIDRIYAARESFLDLEEKAKNAQYAFDLVADLNEQDQQRIAAEQALDDANFERDKALRNLNYILGKAYDQQVAEDFANYDVAQSKLEDAQREWERVMDGPNQGDIAAAEARVAAAEATVALSWIEAPFGGTITKAYPKVGDEITTGESAFRIDDLSELFVEVEISEVDINRIAIGQKAELSFDAILDQKFSAEVIEVSSVGIDQGSGVDFQVKLRILDASEKVRPGMTAAVNIIVSEIKNALYVPNRAIRLMENQRVVFLLKNGELVQVPVEFGASSDVNAEIVSGDIKEGDRVVLNPPMDLINSGQPPAFVR